MYPAIQASIPSYKSGHRPTSHHQNAIPYTKLAQTEQAIPYVKLSQPEQQTSYVKLTQPEQNIPYVKISQSEQSMPLYAKLPQSEQTFPYVKISQAEQPFPYMKISQNEQPGALSLAPPTAIAAVRFVPCFCGNNNSEEKRGFAKTSIPYSATPTGIQPVHLLPCYCPVVREVEPYYTQSSPVPSTTAEPTIGDFAPSTAQPK